MTLAHLDRPLLFNVAGLLGDPPGAFRDLVFVDVAISLGEDLVQADPIAGGAHVRRTNRGLLVTGHVATALAYGTSTIRRVHKVTGPGSGFVAAAKRLLYGTVDVGLPAGPVNLFHWLMKAPILNCSQEIC